MLAIGLSLFPLLVFELLCIVAGWGRPEPTVDPFVGFAAIHPLFVKDAAGTKYVTAQNRLKFFQTDEFAALKAPKEFRIFVLGESTVQGEPYTIRTAFPHWLELALQAADSSQDWQVVNCGGISYASYRLAVILNEVLTYQPDLVILCIGHNEFLEDRTYPEHKQMPQWSQQSVSWLARLRTTVLLSTFFRSKNVPKNNPATTLAADAEPMLDFNNGIAAYHWDPQWQAGIVAHYRFNMQRMIDACRRANVPVVVMKPSSNLADNPPFKSEHDATLAAETLSRHDAEVAAAREQYATNLPQAIVHLEQATQLDPQYALTWYELGRALEAAQEYERARAAFIAARDRDVCPLRMTSSLEAALQEVVARTHVPFLDMHELLEDQVPTGILGDYWLVDHIHPSFEGHQLVATSLLELLAKRKFVSPKEGWLTRAQASFKAHFDSLDRTYFHRGNRKLEALRGWASGRADGPPVETRFPHRVKSP